MKLYKLVALIFNIQRFSIHDGDGIRTTVFFKGCPLACAWCHNPEGRSFTAETWQTADGKYEIVGKNYTVKQLLKELEKDRIFYEQSGGGVTLSGGETLAQNMDFVTELVAALHKSGISVGIDTCGYCDFGNFERVLPYTDFFLYDLKIFDDRLHQTFTGVSNRLILENLKKLARYKARIILRLILLEGVNASDEHIIAILNFLMQNDIHPERIDLLPYHRLGSDKHQRLQTPTPAQVFSAPTNERIEAIRNLLGLFV
ncbi:MAG: glycyl-radical enzyme activating protein [Candidatus Symbiothrix sp.]|nr:glycyl-radical enzyme activating protein [Candidatus Symbiothrix sp.]